MKMNAVPIIEKFLSWNKISLFFLENKNYLLLVIGFISMLVFISFNKDEKEYDIVFIKNKYRKLVENFVDLRDEFDDFKIYVEKFLKTKDNQDNYLTKIANTEQVDMKNRMTDLKNQFLVWKESQDNIINTILPNFNERLRFIEKVLQQTDSEEKETSLDLSV